MPPASAAQAKSAVLSNVISKAISVFVLLSLSLAVFAYRRSLVPLYGSAPTDHHFSKTVWVACIIGSFVPTISVSHATLAAGVLLCLMPNSAYWVAVYTGRMGNVVWGPVATHLLVITPVIALGVAIVKALQQTPDQQDNAAPQQMITLPVAQTSVMALQDLWPVIPYLKDVSENQILLQAGTLALVIWAVSPLMSSPPPTLPVQQPASQDTSKSPVSSDPKRKSSHKKKLSTGKPPTAQPTPPPVRSTPSPQLAPAKSPRSNFARLIILPLLPFLTPTILQPPTLPKPLIQPYLHPAYPLRILSSVRSPVSGVVLVGEVLPPYADQPALGNVHSIRYLRAGHSLLGGAWIGQMATLGRDGTGPAGWDEAGEPVGDSVYHAFMLQEVARLAEKPGGGERENALVIGLGTGVAASALMRSNISTTIVEIDPAVYDAARRFFSLPEPAPGKIIIKDAKGWLRGRVRGLESETTREDGLGTENSDQDQELYDIVLHDVFTGGGLPAHVFTQQFWNDTKMLMHPDGVLAVNFAGLLTSESSKAIVLTLQSAFGHCRAFCDELDPAEKAQDEYHNWVLICTPSTAPITFRAPSAKDFFGSVQRSQIFSTLSRRELDLGFIVGSVSEKQRGQYILTDSQNPLAKWQEKEALSHWNIMRQVFPDVVWETY